MPSRRAPRPSLPLAGAAALACALSVASASADPAPVQLAWVRGPGAEACSRQSAIAQQVTARLGRSPFKADAELAIDAYVTHAEAGWRAEIFVRDRQGKLAGARELTSEASDCGAIESAAVLALALAIDPEAALRPPAPASPAPPPAPAPTPAPVTAPPPATAPLAAPLAASSPPPPRADPPRGTGLGGSGVALRGEAGWGLLPRAAAGLSLAAHMAITERWALTAEALWMPEVSAADDRFAFGLSAFALGACAGVARSSLADLSACGALWGGALHAVVRGLPALEPGDSAWAAASATPRLRLHLGARLHLDLGAQLLVPLVRRPFQVAGWASPVFQQSPAAFLPFAGLGANFP
jgi:hypothetical protein